MRAGLLCFAILCALLVTLVTRLAAADSPVIPPGREKQVVALIAPYFGTGKELTPGYAVGDIRIEARSIEIDVQGPGGARATLTLEHPSVRPLATVRTTSFAVTTKADTKEMVAAVSVLVETIRTNDRAPFFPIEAVPPPTHATDPPSRYASGKVFSIPLPRFLKDGLVLGLAALVATLLHLRRVLRAEARSVTWALLALVGVGALIRLLVSIEAPMNVWPYDRVVPLARAIYEGPLFRAMVRGRVYLTELNFGTTTVLAIVTPLAFFAHARFVLRETRAALFAVALLVVLPMHIRFARADSEFIQSLATSSLTFVTLYTALRDESALARAASFVLLPILSVATYFVRPENLFFYAVDIGAIALASSAETPRLRRAFVFAEVTAAAVFAFVAHVLTTYQGVLREGMSPHTIGSAISLFFHPRLNTLINPAITPPGLTLLAIVGAVGLVRRKEKGRAIFLGAWLLGFFVVHSVVRPSEPAMQARYHMHLVTPLLLLAASSLPEVATWPRRVIVAGAVYLAASPLVHLRFERDTDFNEMREFAFLRHERPAIPDGCTILELMPARDVAVPAAVLSSRWLRMGAYLEAGDEASAYRVVNLGRVTDGAPRETLSTEARAILKNPPPCLFLYLGLTCFSHRSVGEAHAPVCDEAFTSASLAPVASTTFRSRVYDEVLAGRLVTKPNGESAVEQRLVPGEPITLGLYRVTAARLPP